VAGQPQEGATPTWHEVLSSFESNADHAEALVSGAATAVAPAVATYDVWTLPLSELPPDLHARARAMHRRQLQLMDRLQTSMLELQQQQLAATAASEPRASIYLDHRV